MGDGKESAACDFRGDPADLRRGHDASEDGILARPGPLPSSYPVWHFLQHDARPDMAGP